MSVLLLTALAAGVAASPVVLPWESEPPQAQELALPKGLKALRPLSSGLANASFEATNASTGQPLDWSIYRGGIPLLVEGRGGPGTRAARIGGATGYSQALAFDLPLYQTVTAVAWARGSLGTEQIRFTMESYTAASGYLGGVSATRSEALPPGVWAPTYQSYTRTRADEATFSLLLMTRADTDWADVDDVSVLTEGFRNSSLTAAESADPLAGWAMAGGATIETASGELVLPPGGSARQLAAESPLGKDYFLYTTGDVEAELRVTRRDSSGTALGLPELLQSSPTGDVAGGVAFTVPAGSGASVAEVEVSAPPTAEQFVRLGAVSRGFVQAWPARVIVAANSPMPTVRFAAAWPGVLATATLQVVDAGGDEVLGLPLQQDRDSVWAEFDGGALPAGNYRARFNLESADSASTVTREVAFSVERPEPFAAGPQPFAFDGYARMPWIWLYPFTQEMTVETADEAEALLRPAKDDGFNFFLIITSPDQFAVVKEGARRVGVPYVIYEPAMTDSLLNHNGLAWHPDLYLQEMEPFLTFSGEPLFRGVYLRDEPNVQGAEVNDRVRRLALLLERDGRFGTPFSFFSTNPVHTLQNADMPVFSTYQYPVQRTARTNEQRFAHATPPANQFSSYMQETEPDVARARELGKPFWAGVQGYASIVADPAMSPAQASAQFGCTVAMGADGYFTFLYYTLNSLGGLRSLNGDASPRIAIYQDFNARMEALWPLLRTLSPTRTAPPQEHVIARVTEDPQHVPYAVVVNYEERRVSVEVETAAPATMQNVEGGAADAESTTHTLALAPGAWAVLRFDGGAPVRFTGVYEAPRFEKLANVQETARLETGATHAHLALNPAGGNFATLTGDRFRVYTDSGAMILNDYASAGAGYVRYLGANRLLAANSRIGFRVYDLPTAGTATLEFERLRYTGGALDVLLDDNDQNAWLAMAYRGVARASIADGSVALTAFYPSENYDFLSLHGPFADRSVVSMEQTYGPYRFADRGDGSLEARRFDTTQIYDYARTSPNGHRIASGNADRGATVYDVDANGRLLARTRILDNKLIQAEGTAWLSDDTLAVTDLHRGVRFYRVRRGDWTSLGVWKPAPEPFQIECMDATAQGRVAVALSNGQVVFADASALIDEGRAEGWMLE